MCSVPVIESRRAFRHHRLQAEGEVEAELFLPAVALFEPPRP